VKSCRAISKGAELERFVRDAVMTYWRQTGITKMGQVAMSVVDGTLKSME
jgi:choline dehydrogenase